MDLHSILLLIAALLVVVGLIQPLTVRLRLSPTVLLAIVGVAIGLGSAVLMRSEMPRGLASVGAAIVNLPIHSDAFLYIFLPLLLFETALNIEVQRIVEDAAPILLLAVVAVLVATVVIGEALGAIAPVPAAACFMLGSIVATTDPVAVIAIFRDVGAPARLIRLVEGESLLNDAAAITLFVLLLSILTGRNELRIDGAALAFLRNFVGGIAVGIIGTKLVLILMRRLLDFRLAQVTLTLSLAYLVYVIGEQLAVSGVVATVTAGLMLSAVGQPHITPDDWHFLHDVWEQLAFWASSLIFVLASLLVPRMLQRVDWHDLVLLGVLVIAALAARAVVLFALLPLLSALRLSERINHRFKAIIVWGGLRGAVTLALALAVTEHRSIQPEVQRFVGVLATGFVLFTLLINGTTLRVLVRALGLDQLSAFDRALREQVLVLSGQRVSDAVKEVAREYKIPEVLAVRVASSRALPEMAGLPITAPIAGEAEDYRLALGLIALANHERELVLNHFAERTISGRIVEEALGAVGSLIDQTRTGGRREYLASVRRMFDFSRSFRLAHLLHRRFSWDRLLVDRLADRFELLLNNRIMLEELETYARRRLAQLIGSDATLELFEILGERREMTSTALDALRQQYPEYAELLEHRILQKVWLRREEMEYRTLFADGVIGPELYAVLRSDVGLIRDELAERPRLDLGLETRALIAKVPLFASLDKEPLESVARLLRPRFAVPGERLIRDGDIADAMYFLSSGSVEVRVRDRLIKLNPGDFFGEMALVLNQRREGDVTALSYCQLLELRVDEFRNLLRTRPELRVSIHAVAQARKLENEQAPAKTNT
jgi:CPA1 family monovalent cation:H+ antiporter